MARPPALLFPALLFFILLLGPVTSQQSVPLPRATPARDSRPYSLDIRPTSPQHDNTTHNGQTEATEVQRDKRSPDQPWDKDDKGGVRRVKTGDTILNIRGAVRDAIGDGGAAGGTRASTRLDTFVIRPARAQQPPKHHDHHAPPLNQVPRHPRELLVSPHSRAVITCDLDNATDIRWYKDSDLVPLGGSGPSPALWAEGPSVVIARATRGDGGLWRCTGRHKEGSVISGQPTLLLIYEAVRSVYLAVDGRRLDAGNTWVPVRDKTELEVTCVAEGGIPPPELSWRLLTSEPSLDHRPYLSIRPTNYSIEGVSVSTSVVRAARELHNATLTCEGVQRHTDSDAPATPMAAKLEVHVTYPPSFVISRWPGFGVSLVAGAAAALRCDVDANPPARAWWLRDDDPTSSPPPLEAGGEARGSATLRWAALRAAHGGWYRCRASWLDHEYSSIGYYLNVIAPEQQTAPPEEEQQPEQVPQEQPLEQQTVDVQLGGSVQLHCPKGSVGCWWRRVGGNGSMGWAPAGAARAHGVLSIKDALYQEGGEYRCLGTPPHTTRHLQELKRVTVRVGGGASAAALSAQPSRGGWRLECGVCGRGVRALWLLGGRSSPAALLPDLAAHCHRAVLHVATTDEVWCVASTPSGGAVAVFPPRSPQPSPAPARHTVRAPYNCATISHSHIHLALLAACLCGLR